MFEFDYKPFFVKCEWDCIAFNDDSYELIMSANTFNTA